MLTLIHERRLGFSFDIETADTYVTDDFGNLQLIADEEVRDGFMQAMRFAGSDRHDSFHTY